MKTVEIWTRIFWEASKVRDNNNPDNAVLERILKDATGYLQNIHDADNEDLETLLDKEKGLLKFLETAIAINEENRLRGSLREALNILQFLIEFFQEEYKPYLVQTMNICNNYIIKDVPICVKRKACEVFKKLIQTFGKSVFTNLQLGRFKIECKDLLSKIFNCEYKKFKILNFVDTGIWFIIFSTLVKYCPDIVNSDLTCEVYIALYWNLNRQISVPDHFQNQDDIEIYIESLSNMLPNFVPSEEVANENYFSALYKAFVFFCDPKKPYKIVIKIVGIIGVHMQYFSSLICLHYEKWHVLLNYLYENNFDDTVVNALRNFYKIIASYLLQLRAAKILLHFRNYFMKSLTDTQISFSKMCIIAYGLGEFNVVYKNYLPTEIFNGLQQVIFYILSVFIKNKSRNNIVEKLPYYIQCFSEFLKNVPDMSLHYINLLEKFYVLMIEKFPELDVTNQRNVVNSLKITFFNINQLLEEFHRNFYFLFYKGLLCSCSYSLFDDIKLRQEIQNQNLPKSSICYKNYLPVWHSLFKTDNDHENFAKQMFAEFSLAIIYFLDNLNLNIKQKEICLLDNSPFMGVENEGDHRYFANFVDLIIEIFEDIDIVLLKLQAEKFLDSFIQYSYKYPTTSGFYKLIKTIFMKLDFFYNFENDFEKSFCKFICQYLSDVLKLIHRFSGELQLSCIYLIFSTPQCFIISILYETIPVLKTALKIGLFNISLAFDTMNILENWTRNLQNLDLNDFCKQIILDIEPYLKINRNSDIWESIRKTKKEMAAHTIICNDDISFQTLQKKILLFYGTLEFEILTDLIHEKSLETGMSWIKDKVLVFELNFPDDDLKINLDLFLSNVIQNIENGDQRIKFLACKLLHRMFMIISGKDSMDQYLDKNLFLLFLKLGCDSDNLIRCLYHPLMQQWNYYLSSKTMIKSKICQQYLEAIFEGLAEDFNLPLRDYCNHCMKQFMQWANKQYSSDYLNHSAFISQIINLALSPSKNKRFAAAMVLNNLLSNVSLNLYVVNIHGLEMFYAFVKCLDDEEDYRYTAEIYKALINIQLILKKFIRILSVKSVERIKPPGFSGETLKDAAIWLLTECYSLNAHYRAKCMNLLENFCIFAQSDLLKQFFISSYKMDFINDVTFKNRKGDINCITVNNMKTFIRSLDIYNWILEKKFLESEDIFLSSEGEENVVFTSLIELVSIIISDNNVQEIIEKSTDTSKEAQEVIDLINLAIMKIFQFICTLLLAKGENSTQILESFWSDDFCLLISGFVLFPHDIGLTVKTIQTIYPKKREKIIEIILQNLPEIYLTKLMEYLIKRNIDDLESFINFQNIHDFDIIRVKPFVEGTIILKRFDMLDFDNQVYLPVQFMRDQISGIFENVFAMDGIIPFDVIDYLREIMNFCLLKYEPEIVEMLVPLIVNYCESDGGSIIPLYTQFFEMFKTPICRCMLLKPNETLNLLDRILLTSLDKIFFLIRELIKFAHRTPSKDGANFAMAVLCKCNEYNGKIFSNIGKLKQKFLEINRIAVQVVLQNSPKYTIPEDILPSDLYSWISEQFRASSKQDDFTLMSSFLVCLTNEESRSTVNYIFNNLRDKDTSVWLKKLELNIIEKSLALQCLCVIFDVLHDTKSVLIYEHLIKYVTGVCKIFPRELIHENIQKFVKTAPEEKLKVALNATYENFKDSTCTPDERFDVLEYFLIPSLESCTSKLIANFGVSKITDFCSVALKDLDEDDVIQRKHTLISKICSFKIFELIFGRVYPTIANVVVAGTREPLTEYLHKDLMEIRSHWCKNPEEIVFWRLAHCAALNCLIAIYCATNNKQIYLSLFKEDREKHHLIWDRIVDCNKKYEFKSPPLSFVERPLNIHMTKEEMQLKLHNAIGTSYFRRDDPDETSKNANVSHVRYTISLEEDDLNNHECMAMVVNVIQRYAKLLTVDQGEVLPHWLEGIRSAFATNESNVWLFLLKLVLNMKDVFLSYMNNFFVPIVVVVTAYLTKNKLNYFIRDVLYFIIESKHQLNSDMKDIAQELVEILIDRARDSQTDVYKANLELIASLVAMWKNYFRIPRNLKEKIRLDPELALQIIAILVKEDVDLHTLTHDDLYGTFIKNFLSTWQNEITPIAFETTGRILQYAKPEVRNYVVNNVLLNYFDDMHKKDYDNCARMVYLIYTNFEELVSYEVHQFVNPSVVKSDELRAGCYEIFLSSMKYLGELPDVILNNVKSVRVSDVLCHRIFPCVKVAMKIMHKLTSIIDAKNLLSFAKLVQEYTKEDMLVEFRMMAYELFIRILERYSSVEQLSKDEKSIMELSTQVLIAGTADASNDVQDFVLHFWKKNAKLPKASFKRLLVLIALYSPEVDPYYVQFICLLLLDLTTLAPNHRDALFEESTNQSLTKKNNETITNINQTTLYNHVVNHWKAPLFVSSARGAFDRADVAGSIPEVIERIRGSNENVHSRRSFSQISRDKTAREEGPSTVKFFEKLKKERLEQMNDIKLDCENIITQFPNTIISQAHMVDAFEGLVRRDRGFAGDLAASIINELIKNLKDSANLNDAKHKNMLKQITETMTKTCQEAMTTSGAFAPVAIKILLLLGDIEFDATAVTQAAKLTGVQFLAVSLLENDNIKSNEELYRSQMVIRNKIGAPIKMQYQVQLADLYRSIGDNDTVRSIFKNWVAMTDSKSLQNASLAEAEGDQSFAIKNYKQAYTHTSNDQYIKQYCLEGMFKCYSELSKWWKINDKIAEIVEKKYNSLWENDFLLPWAIKSEVQNILIEIGFKCKELSKICVLSDIDERIRDQGTKITKPFGEELSMIFLRRADQVSVLKAKHCLKHCLDDTRERWRLTNYFDEESKFRIVAKLKRINEIDTYLRTMKLNNIRDSAIELTKYWEKNLPRSQDNCLSWDEIMDYRLVFRDLLIDRFNNMKTDTYNPILENLELENLKVKLNITNLAIQHKNPSVASKHLLQLNIMDRCTSYITHEYELMSLYHKFLYSMVGSHPLDKIKHCAVSWKSAYKLFKCIDVTRKVELSTEIKLRHYIFRIILAIDSLFLKDRECMEYIKKDKYISEILDFDDNDAISECIQDYGVNILKQIGDKGNSEDIAKTHMLLAAYYLELLSTSCRPNLNFQEQFIAAVLKMMEQGSTKAIRYFACLLNPSTYESPEYLEQVSNQCQNVPTWMFLPLQEAIVSKLNIFYTVPIIKRLVKEYPSSIMYSLRGVCEAHPELRNNPEINNVYQIIFSNPKVDNFFKAMEYLCQSEHYLQHYLLKFIHSTNSSEQFFAATDIFFREMCSTTEPCVAKEKISLKSTNVNKIIVKYQKDIEKLKTITNYDDLVTHINKICDELNKAMKERLKENKEMQFLRLQNYSPYLKQFTQMSEDIGIEIPGQCTRESKPLPHYHVKIARINESIEIINSRNNDIKISLVGTNGQTYNYLVKFGKEMEQNQRIQRIFTTLNKSIYDNEKCRRRHLSINTYNILPLSKTVCLIKWIDGVKSLREYIESSITDKTNIQNLAVEYQSWIEEANNNPQNNKSNIYKQALLKYKAKTVVAKMKELIRSIDWDILRKTFQRLSSSVECFFKLRQNFIRSYATMCIVHWIIGASDRRLENTLIEVHTAKCFGINFSIVFDVGFLLPAPEFVPFRLTTQILGLLRPYKEHLFGETMCHVLGALKNNKTLICACLNALLHESSDWNEKLKEELKKDNSRNNDIKLKWSPKKKLDIIESKLNGVNPSLIIVKQLAYVQTYDNDEDDQYFKVYERIVNGTEEYHTTARAFIKSLHLTPEQQVDWLLDQAVDFNLLARMPVKWYPFV